VSDVEKPEPEDADLVDEELDSDATPDEEESDAVLPPEAPA